MFTEQVGQLDKLVGIVPDQVLEVLKSLLGNCAQELVHRGPVTFDGPVTFTNITNLSVAGTVLFGKATAKWTNGGAVGSNVACNKCDQAGTLTGGTVTIYLPSTGAMQPNVRTGDVVAYTVDDAGDAIATSDYLDDRIGTIKAWGDPLSIPGGWQEIAAGATIFGYSNGDPDFGVLGGTGGTRSHTHDAHDASDIADHAASNTGSSGGGTLTFVGSTGSTTSTGSVSSATDSIAGSGDVTTSNQSANPTITGISGDAISKIVDVSDPGHDHTITPTHAVANTSPSDTIRDSPTTTNETLMTFEGQGTGDGPSLSSFHVAMARSAIFSGISLTGNHNHIVHVGDIVGYLSVGSHTHTLTMSPHAHTITGSGTTSTHSHTTPALSHSGSLSHNSAQHLPPYYVAVWIQRYE